jgi:tetratricopeptide repeat protein
MALSKKQNRIGYFVCLAVVLIILGSIYGPTAMLRWNYRIYQDQHEARLYAQAEELLPTVQKSTTASLHFKYQDFMKDAGKIHVLQQQYKAWVDKDPKNAALIALQSRIAGNSKQKETLLEKALKSKRRNQPKNETALFVKIEDILDSGMTLEAAQLITQIKSECWLRYLMESRIARRIADIDGAKDAFKKAINAPGVPISVANEYANFICSWTDMSTGARPNPFAQWGKQDLQQNPIAYAYHAWLADKISYDSPDELPNELLYNPEALAIYCRPALTADTPNSQLDKIETLMNRAKKIAPENPKVLVNYGLMELAKRDTSDNDIKKANAYFSTGLDKSIPAANSLFHVQMGDELSSLKKIIIAEQHYKKAWGKMPEDGLFLKLMADFHIENESQTDAIKILEQARAILPHDSRMLHKLGDIYFKKDDLDKARGVYGMLIEIDEHDNPARDRIAEIWLKKNNPSRAIQVYNVLAKRDPNNGHCYAQVAHILIKHNSIDQADKLLKKVLKKYPDIRDKQDILEAVNAVELAKNKQ